MAEVSEPASVLPVGHSDQGLRRDDKQRRRPPPPAPPPRSATEIADTASVMGIPPEELTPRVQEALSAILAEFDRQRAELDHIRAHESFLESEADHHAFLPIPNRRAFHRILSRVLTHVAQSEAGASLAVLVIANLGDLRLRHGRRAAEAALTHLAQAVKEAIRASDFLGCLGGDELGVILTLAGAEEAVRKMGEIVESVASRPFHWEGEPFPLEAVFGIHALVPDETTDAAIAAADPAFMGERPPELEGAPESSPESAP